MPTHNSVVSLFNDIADAIRDKIPSTHSLSKTPGSYSTSGTINNANYKNTIGKGSDTEPRTGNDYSSSSGSTAYIEYSFDFSDIPANATISSVTVTVLGHCEDVSRSTARVQLYSGSTAKGSALNFTKIDDEIYTVSAGTWTRSELQNAKLRFTIGYYGGLVSGATWTVVYIAEGTGTTIVADDFPTVIDNTFPDGLRTGTKTKSGANSSSQIQFTSMAAKPKMFSVIVAKDDSASMPYSDGFVPGFFGDENGTVWAAQANRNNSGNYIYYGYVNEGSWSYSGTTLTIGLTDRLYTTTTYTYALIYAY